MQVSLVKLSEKMFKKYVDEVLRKRFEVIFNDADEELRLVLMRSGETVAVVDILTEEVKIV